MNYDIRDIKVMSGVDATTLNAWIQREHFPGICGAGRGRMRRFTYREAMLVVITARLVRGGLSAPKAARVTAKFLDAGRPSILDAIVSALCSV
jgi:hypothetical protein